MLTFLLNITLKVIARAIWQDKEIKTWYWEERSKTLFLDDMIAYVENCKDSQETLELINPLKLQDTKFSSILCTKKLSEYLSKQTHLQLHHKE